MSYRIRVGTCSNCRGKKLEVRTVGNCQLCEGCGRKLKTAGNVEKWKRHKV